MQTTSKGLKKMENKFITDIEMKKITEKFSLRDTAFIAFVRQSGLKPSTIAQLKIRHVEKLRTGKTPIPCRIEIAQEVEKNKFGRHISFIGEETVYYLKKYFIQRELGKEKLTSESLLFIIYNKPDKQILTKELSRTLKNISQRIIGKKIGLNDLRNLFLEKAKDIERNHINYMIGEPPKNYVPENDEFYRRLYKELLMDALSIEPMATTNKIRKETYELNERLERIENVLFPKTRIIKDPIAEAEKIERYCQKYPERVAQEEEWYNQQVAEAEEIERLMKKDPWHYACYIQQIATKIKIIEDTLRTKSVKD